jgi:hypothetical protein
VEALLACKDSVMLALHAMGLLGTAEQLLPALVVVVSRCLQLGLLRSPFAATAFLQVCPPVCLPLCLSACPPPCLLARQPACRPA